MATVLAASAGSEGAAEAARAEKLAAAQASGVGVAAGEVEDASTIIKGGIGSWRLAILHDWRQLRFAPEVVRGDPVIVLSAVDQDPHALQYATEGLRGDKALVLEAVRRHGETLQHASEALKSDREVVAEALKENHFSLRHASPDLRTDVELIAESMARNGHTLECSSRDFAAPPPSVRKATNHLEPARWRTKVARDWGRLKLAPPDVRGDKQILLQAIQDSWGAALQFASEELQDDRGVVIDAVRWSGVTLEYASEALRNDTEVVAEAVAQSWKALRFASEELRGDQDIALVALAQSTDALELVSNALRADRDFVLRAVSRDGHALRHAATQLREDREIVMEASKNNWLSLKHVSPEVREEIGNAIVQAVHALGQTTRWVDQPGPPPYVEPSGRIAGISAVSPPGWGEQGHEVGEFVEGEPYTEGEAGDDTA